MAAKPSPAVKDALQKIQDQVTCGICLDPYKQPRLLNCFHVFCEQCLQPQAQHEGGQSVSCPTCRKVTPLPEGGVTGLQGAFYIYYLFEIQDALQKVSSSNQLTCKKCNKREATGFCQTCGFVCQRCTETHQEWKDLQSHELIDLDTLTGDITTLVPPLKKTIFCAYHSLKKAKLFCETCNKLICRDCIVRTHRDHEYDLVSESFAKQEQVIVDTLKPVEEQVVMLEKTLESVAEQCVAVKEQKRTRVADIHTTFTTLRQALEKRETELVDQAELTTQQQLESLTVQQDELELQLGQLKSCRDFVRESRRTCSEGEILEMKSKIVEQINNIVSSLKPVVVERPTDLQFTHNLPDLLTACQKFGTVGYHQVSPEKCRLWCRGIQVAMKEQTLSITLEQLDDTEDINLGLSEGSRCQLIASNGSSRVRGTVKRRDKKTYDIRCKPIVTDQQHTLQIESQAIMVATRGKETGFSLEVVDKEGRPYLEPVRDLRAVIRTGNSEINPTIHRRTLNMYDISYQTEVTGVHQLHILTENQPILNIPVAHLPDFSNPVEVIEDLNSPWGVVVSVGGEVVVTERDSHCVSIISSTGERKTFGSYGSDFGHFIKPEGVAIDCDGNILVADYNNRNIQQFLPTGEHLRTVGTYGNRPLQFSAPVGIAVHPHNHRIYITDTSNHKIQVLKPDLNYCKSFGSKGSSDRQFNEPYDLAFDSEGNVYVADTNNHRIQVFTVDGVYLRQLGKDGSGKLSKPISIAIDQRDLVYVGEWYGDIGLSVYLTSGEFVASFGRTESVLGLSWPYGLAVDNDGRVYVGDGAKGHLQIFH